MKTTIIVEKEETVLVHLNGITYKTVPYWYNTTVRELRLDLILPKQPELRHNLPLLIWACGGAFSQMDRNVWLPSLVEFAKAGYAVASIDYRTAPVWPFSAAVEDIRSAVRFLRAHSDMYGLDPNRFVTMGESAGGYLACMAALGGSEYDKGDDLTVSSSVQAVVDFYGKVDYREKGQDAVCNKQVIDDFLNNNSDVGFLNHISCCSLVDDTTCPMLLFHGENDSLVSISESEGLYEALQKHGVHSDFYVLKGAEHGEDIFYQPAIRKIVLEFLSEVL